MREMELFRIPPGKSEFIKGVRIEYRPWPNGLRKDAYIRSDTPLRLGEGRSASPDQWQVLLAEHKWRDGAWHVELPRYYLQRLVIKEETGVLTVKLKYPEGTAPFPESNMSRFWH